MLLKEYSPESNELSWIALIFLAIIVVLGMSFLIPPFTNVP